MILILMLTTIIQTTKAARTNPADNLRMNEFDEKIYGR